MASLKRSRSFQPLVDQPNSSPDVHNNLLSFLAVCQDCNVDIFSITWQQALGLAGEGGTARVNQSKVYQGLEFVFKRWDWTRTGPQLTNTTASKMYRAFMSETWILNRPAIKEAAYIVRLEGICWDFPNKGPPLPVLVFEKAMLGDLDAFISSPRGAQISLSERVNICLKIAKALMLLHSQRECAKARVEHSAYILWAKNIIDVIHGDIKPSNILIFEDSSQNLVPKITDFGFSTFAPQGTELVYLAISEPWCAPEIHSRKFSFENAKRADIFSLGMLTLWVLFSQEILTRSRDNTDSRGNGDDASEINQAKFMLQILKEHGNLVKLAEELISNSSLSDIARQKLHAYFSMTLEQDPTCRVCQLEDVFADIGGQLNETEEYHMVAQRQPFIHFHPRFDLSVSFRNLMVADYRVRDHLFDSVLKMCSQCECEVCNEVAMLNVAIFYRIGFGTILNTAQSIFWIRKADKTEEDLQALIELLRSETNDRYYQNKRVKNLINEAIVETLDHIEDISSLPHLKGIYSRQLQDMESIFGRSHHVVYNLKRTLALILNEETASQRAAADLMIDLVYDGDNDPAYGSGHPATISMRNQLCATLLWLNSLDEAETYGRDAAKSATVSLGSSHPLTLEALQVLTATFRMQCKWGQAERLQKRVIRKKSKFFGENHPNTLRAKSDLSEIYSAQCLYNAALEILKEVWKVADQELGTENSYTLRYSIQYAAALNSIGNYQEAEVRLQQAVDIAVRLAGEDNYATIRAQYQLSCTYHGQGRLQQAEKLLTEILDKEVKIYGEGSTELLESKARLGYIYMDMHRGEEAENLLHEVMESGIKELGAAHPETLVSIGKYAAALAENGEYSEAANIAHSCLIKCKKKLGQDDPRTLTSMSTFAKILLAQGKLREAEELERTVLQMQGKRQDKDYLQILSSLCSLGEICKKEGKLNEAQILLEKAFRKCEKRIGPYSPLTFLAMRILCSVYIEQNDLDKAELIELKLLRRQTHRSNDCSLEIVGDVVELISIFLAKGKRSDAEELVSQLQVRIDQFEGELRIKVLKTMSRLVSKFQNAEMFQAAERIAATVDASSLVDTIVPQR